MNKTDADLLRALATSQAYSSAWKSGLPMTADQLHVIVLGHVLMARDPGVRRLFGEWERGELVIPEGL